VFYRNGGIQNRHPWYLPWNDSEVCDRRNTTKESSGSISTNYPTTKTCGWGMYKHTHFLPCDKRASFITM